MSMNAEWKYERLRTDINALYQRYMQKCGLPEETEPERQIQVLEERCIARLKKQIEDSHESAHAVKVRIKCLMESIS